MKAAGGTALHSRANSTLASRPSEPEPPPTRLPRLGFLGVGWIGRQRMDVLAASGSAEIVGIADPSPEMRLAAHERVPGAELVDSLDRLLTLPLDGLVIATPSAQHAEQAIAALENGLSVFCQKPLGRSAEEVARVVTTAERMDRLLEVDLSYRHAAAFRAVRDVVAAGEIGHVFAADLVFHNAYGPDRSWFYDPTLSGGGCVIDLGVHLVDTALWVLGFPPVEEVGGRLFAGGRPLENALRVEDFATARLDLVGGATVQLACSWNLAAGQEAVISATFFGTAGGVAVHNLNGSFFDFTAERYLSTRRTSLVAPPDAWPGRAALAWAERLAAGARFDAAAQDLVTVAEVIDRIYGR